MRRHALLLTMLLAGLGIALGYAAMAARFSPRRTTFADRKEDQRPSGQ